MFNSHARVDHKCSMPIIKPTLSLIKPTLCAKLWKCIWSFFSYFICLFLHISILPQFRMQVWRFKYNNDYWIWFSNFVKRPLHFSSRRIFRALARLYGYGFLDCQSPVIDTTRRRRFFGAKIALWLLIFWWSGLT